jgi:formylmethanofuran dehydrogenase subunit C
MTLPSIALNLDPFGRGRKAVPDSVQKVKPEVDELVERAYREYLGLPLVNYFREREYILEIELIKDNIILNSSQIELLLDRMIDGTQVEKVNHPSTSLYLTTLIQNSYTYGHYNDFKLTTGDSKLVNIGLELQGSKDKRIILTLDGNVGYGCGEEAEYTVFSILGDGGEMCGEYVKHSEFSIRGNVGWRCGEEAEHSDFSIQGNADWGCGLDAKHSRFNIKGNAGNGCGRVAENSNFSIRGNAGDLCGAGAKHSYFNIYGNAGKRCGEEAKYCNFIVHSRELFERLKKDLRPINRVVLMDDADNILEEMQI